MHGTEPGERWVEEEEEVSMKQLQHFGVEGGMSKERHINEFKIIALNCSALTAPEVVSALECNSTAFQ